MGAEATKFSVMGSILRVWGVIVLFDGGVDINGWMKLLSIPD